MQTDLILILCLTNVNKCQKKIAKWANMEPVVKIGCLPLSRDKMGFFFGDSGGVGGGQTASYEKIN